MSVCIRSVLAASPAARAGIAGGDTLLRINGHDITDVLDYRFYMTGRHLALELLDAGKKPYRAAVRKPEYDDLGLEFDTYLMDKQHSCKNKCVFCFIDQLPPGLRESLYFKDDDDRMSFLFGNYITLTNLEDRDVQRIIDMHISPVNISVHTTNPQLRVEMMANPCAGQVLDYIPRLAGAGIKVNTQLVLCPGLNDGEELSRSLNDLGALAPNLQSISVVPVGITKYREGLYPQRLFTRREAGQVIEAVEAFGERMLKAHGQRTAFCADELYLRAGRPLHPHGYYEDFYQLENGVGLLTLLDHEFRFALEEASAPALPRHVSIATGQAAYPKIQQLAGLAVEKFPDLRIDVYPIANDFFGHTITVAGLVCGGDLVAQLRGKDLGDALLFPAVMLRHERDLFLDGTSVGQVSQALGVPATYIENDGWELLDAMLGNIPDGQ